MSVGETAFTAAERAYLSAERRLAHVATVGPDGMPHVTPLGMWSFSTTTETIDIQGHDFARTKKFRDVARTHHAAIVIDDVVPPWQPRGIEIRGDAEAIPGPPAADPHPTPTDRLLGDREHGIRPSQREERAVIARVRSCSRARVDNPSASTATEVH